MVHPDTIARIDKARDELNATPWWRFLKRQDAADHYKRVLLAGAFEEIQEAFEVTKANPVRCHEDKADEWLSDPEQVEARKKDWSSPTFDPTYYLEGLSPYTVDENTDGTFTLFYKNVELTVEIKNVVERW